MKTKKSARKYAASGKLKQAIQARHQHKQMKKKIEGRQARKAKGKRPAAEKVEGRADDDGMDDDLEMEEDEKELYKLDVRTSLLVYLSDFFRRRKIKAKKACQMKSRTMNPKTTTLRMVSPWMTFRRTRMKEWPMRWNYRN
jgi:hypothetical protein